MWMIVVAYVCVYYYEPLLPSTEFIEA
jgi:hypothetical protein